MRVNLNIQLKHNLTVRINELQLVVYNNQCYQKMKIENDGRYKIWH